MLWSNLKPPFSSCFSSDVVVVLAPALDPVPCIPVSVLGLGCSSVMGWMRVMGCVCCPGAAPLGLNPLCKGQARPLKGSFSCPLLLQKGNNALGFSYSRFLQFSTAFCVVSQLIWSINTCTDARIIFLLPVLYFEVSRNVQESAENENSIHLH